MNKIDEQKAIDAVPGTGGIQAAIAQKIGCARETICRLAAVSEKLREAIQEEKEKLLDLAESKLYNLIKEGDKTMIIFFLKTQGKNRGYLERQEISDVSDQDKIADALNELIQSVKKKGKGE